MSGTHCSELGAHKPGPKPSPNALKFKSVGLTQEFWDWLKQFATEAERAAIVAEEAEGRRGNYTTAMQRMVDAARRFMPGGEKGGMPRDAKGRFVSTGGTSRTAKTRERRRARKGQETV